MKINIELESGYSSCNNCNVTNYRMLSDKADKQISKIYRIKIGCMANCLCPDCLAELIGKATVTLAAEKMKQE